MHVVFYLLAIFCLIVLSLVLLHIRRGPDYPVRGIFPDKAVNAYMHANGQYHELRYEFATGVRALEGEYMPIIYPDWLNEYVIGPLTPPIPSLTDPYQRMGDDLELIWKKMRESLLLLPFTKLYNDALRADEPVQAARVEVKVVNSSLPKPPFHSPLLPSVSSTVH